MTLRQVIHTFLIMKEVFNFTNELNPETFSRTGGDGIRKGRWLFGLIWLMVMTVLISLSGCRQEEVAEPFEPTTSHEAYRDGLIQMDLADTEMGRRWISTAEQVFTRTPEVTLPHREVLFFDPSEPDARGFLFFAERGRSIRIGIEFHDGSEPRFFADLFRVKVPKSASGQNPPEGEVFSRDSDDFSPLQYISEEQVASYSREERVLVFEPRRDNHYILRFQPELLRGGMFTLSIIEEPVLAFPVEGRGVGDIQSFFGDPRDGGRRMHEGVDIFAARGTNVLAVTDGVVRRVGTRDLGGNIVLLWDEKRRLNYYYAHLDVQYVTSGQRVTAGEPLGEVGNTGNAVTTPPHLHFGVYEPRFRAVDPWNFLKPAEGKPQEVVAADAAPGDYIRTAEDINRSGLPETISSGTVLRLVGMDSRILRVREPGSSDLIELEPGEAEMLDEPIGIFSIANDSAGGIEQYLYSGPGRESGRIGMLNTAEGVNLLGYNGRYLYVETGNGGRGWVRGL